jgi:FixJ family two-component response regulator
MTSLGIATLSVSATAPPSLPDGDRDPTDGHLRAGHASQLLHQFADRSTSAFWILDIDAKRLLYCNPAFSRMVGDGHHHLGAWHVAVHPEDRTGRNAALARMCVGEAFAHDYRITRPDGAVRVIHETCFPLGHRADGPLCAGGICEDVTTETLPTVYLVDDGDGYMQALCAAGYKVTRFDNTAALLDVAPVLMPGCLVLNVQCRDGAILRTVAALHASRADMPLVMLGDCEGDVGVAIQAMKAGAADFLQTPVTPQVLLRAVAANLVRVKEAAPVDNPMDLTRLHLAAMSPRERQVLDGLLACGTNKSIGRDLGLSPRTVEAHRSRIMNRLGARSLADAILMMAAAGIVAGQGGGGARGAPTDRGHGPGARIRPT